MKKNVFFFPIWMILPLCVAAGDTVPSVKDVMDSVVTRMYETLSSEERAKLNDRSILEFLTDEEKEVLSTRFWSFETDVPVVVSVMRNVDQPTVPFWLPERGFKKTSLKVRNEIWEYEVWQKTFDAGWVGLGVNGFDMHRTHYFVCVGPADPDKECHLANFFPENQPVGVMREGSMIYQDWTELVLTEVPRELRGQILLPTYRGRAREAHLIRAFRRTPHPSSAKPDQVMLTWSEDPKTTQTIQWRTGPQTSESFVRYREIGSQEPFKIVAAASSTIEDRMLENDRYVHRFTVVLKNLKPGTTYEYAVGSLETEEWSEPHRFTTAPDGEVPFSFIFNSDTHCSPHWGRLLQNGFKQEPRPVFCVISGDLVGTGLFRDEWDRFFYHSKNVFNRIPVLPSIGNHDDQDGLGAWMYLALFALPKNGPESLEPERVYSVRYGNALFLILDIGTPYDHQARWMEKVMAGSDATWKFAVIHFPPYSVEEDYQDIRAAIGPVIDEYHVDIVLSGHTHTYLRSRPIRGGKVVDSPEEGTVYILSVAVPGEPARGHPDYAVTAFGSKALSQIFHIDGKRLSYRCYDEEGNLCDEMVIEKP